MQEVAGMSARRARPRDVPEVFPFDERYLDVDALFDDLAAYAGSRSLNSMAMAVGLNRDTLRRLRNNDNTSLWLETYARLCATLGRPWGTWLKSRR